MLKTFIPLAVFSLNGYAPGSVANVNPGANNISITDNDFTKTYYFTATSDCYYRVVVTFKNQYGEMGGCCLVNPVYVNLP
jgi:hypothetical protein